MGHVSDDGFEFSGGGSFDFIDEFDLDVSLSDALDQVVDEGFGMMWVVLFVGDDADKEFVVIVLDDLCFENTLGVFEDGVESADLFSVLCDEDIVHAAPNFSEDREGALAGAGLVGEGTDVTEAIADEWLNAVDEAGADQLS